MTATMSDELRWHLDPTSGPKRILALDGGGVRGLVTLGMLECIESTLARRCPKPEEFRLCHYFDLIAGTSTGSIIATALALGWRVAEVKKLYEDICPAAFAARAWGLFRSVYDPRPLERKLRDVLGDTQLQSDKLRTGLMICAKRMDTGSPWVLTNNPRSKFWESPDRRYQPNKEYELWRIVRASTAAPLYYEPVKMVINPPGGTYEAQTGVFVDGGVGGFNNPSWQALLVATLPAYGFIWQTGFGNLFMVSVGTGWWRMRKSVDEYLGMNTWQQAAAAISAMVQDTVLHTVTAMQAVSSPRKPWKINTEIDYMRNLDGSYQRVVRDDLLTFQRYDAFVEAEQVARLFNYSDPASPDVKRVLDELRKIGNTDKQVLSRLYTLGHNVGHVTQPGRDGIEPEDFPMGFDPPYA